MAKNKTLEQIHETIEAIAESIAGEHSHGYHKHHCQRGEFSRPEYGAAIPIDDAEDLKRHAYKILTSPETMTVHTTGLRFYAWHPPTRTLCIINPGTADRDGGTIYRRPADADADGRPWHVGVTELDANMLKVDGFREKPGGMLARLQADARTAQHLLHAYEDMQAERIKHRRKEQECDFKRNSKDVSRPRHCRPRSADHRLAH